MVKNRNNMISTKFLTNGREIWSSLGLATCYSKTLAKLDRSFCCAGGIIRNPVRMETLNPMYREGSFKLSARLLPFQQLFKVTAIDMLQSQMSVPIKFLSFYCGVQNCLSSGWNPVVGPTYSLYIFFLHKMRVLRFFKKGKNPM